MIPKSILKLRQGDACFIQRMDGKFALFVYIQPQVKNSRSAFYGALATVVFEAAEIESVPGELRLGDHALVHIKCYRENNTPIVGNVVDKLDPAQLDRISHSIGNTNVGATTKVWGHLTIVEYANRVASS